MDQKAKISAILSVVLTAVVALLAVFGYHVVIVAPAVAGLEAQLATPTMSIAGSGAPLFEPAAGGGCVRVCLEVGPGE